jgi:tetratricopeptide (TPR) repeat protein
MAGYIETGVKFKVDASDLDVKFARSVESLNASLTTTQRRLGLAYDANKLLTNSLGRCVEGLSTAQIKLGLYVDELGRVRTFQGGFASGVSNALLAMGAYSDEFGNIYNRAGEFVERTNEANRALEEQEKAARDAARQTLFQTTGVDAALDALKTALDKFNETTAKIAAAFERGDVDAQERAALEQKAQAEFAKATEPQEKAERAASKPESEKAAASIREGSDRRIEFLGKSVGGSRIDSRRGDGNAVVVGRDGGNARQNLAQRGGGIRLMGVVKADLREDGRVYVGVRVGLAVAVRNLSNDERGRPSMTQPVRLTKTFAERVAKKLNAPEPPTNRRAADATAFVVWRGRWELLAASTEQTATLAKNVGEGDDAYFEASKLAFNGSKLSVTDLGDGVARRENRLVRRFMFVF